MTETNTMEAEVRWDDLSETEQNNIITIVNDINETHLRIQKSREKASQVEKTFFLQVKKRDQLLADAIYETNMAVDELAKIQQKAIIMTCQSADTAYRMMKMLSQISKNGISDANVQIEALAQDQLRSMDAIIDATERYYIQQKENEDRISKFQKLISVSMLIGGLGIILAIISLLIR
ncbi:MAG: hypothetical protein ACI4RH_09365 [Huintestinicola sp.]